MKWWIKFGCFLTGWNYKILQNCSEASYKALKKYVSSMLILIILWGITGYCFADRYIGFDKWWQCALTSFAFIVIIVQVERQITLSVGKLQKKAAFFRVFIAVIMAFLGSAILDQIIFKADIENKMAEVRIDEINDEVPKRQLFISKEIDVITAVIDSINTKNSSLYNEITKEGWTITRTNVTSSDTKTGQFDPNGNEIVSKKVETNKIEAENPKAAIYRTNETAIENYRKQLASLSEKRLNTQQIVEEEYKSKKNGFMEELKAMIKILATSPISLVFYILLFCFLITLELFVLTAKSGDKMCDYELIVDHQLKVKADALQDLIKKESKS